MAHRVKVRSKHQIAVPAAVCRRLAIDSDDHLVVEIQDGVIVLIPEPKDALEELKGLGRDLWEGVDIKAYIDQERDKW